MQECGLQAAYTEDQGTYSLLRKVMALPFLPEAEIVPIFEHLQRQATTERLSDFMEYVSRTWAHRNASWPPSCWSVYLRSVRTNNDVEGWHHGLNLRCHGKTQLPFYVLIQLLHEEAKLVSLQIRLVSERKLKRMQRSVYRQLQSRIFTLWEEYKSGERTSKQLLRACARLYGPRDI